MVITLSDASSKLYIPVLPEKIEYKSSANFHEYNIINKGQIKKPNGNDLDSVAWESFFPGEKLKNHPLVTQKNGMKPSEYHKKIKDWKDNGEEINLNITGTPINMQVYIESYKASVQDAYGSIYYSVKFIEALDVRVDTTKSKPISRPKLSSGSGGSGGGGGGNSYPVKSGDTLWDIAKKFYGNATQWPKIYDANAGVIESTAKSRGKKSSGNGHWIYPGTILTIP